MVDQQNRCWCRVTHWAHLWDRAVSAGDSSVRPSVCGFCVSPSGLHTAISWYSNRVTWPSLTPNVFYSFSLNKVRVSFRFGWSVPESKGWRCFNDGACMEVKLYLKWFKLILVLVNLSTLEELNYWWIHFEYFLRLSHYGGEKCPNLIFQATENLIF